MATGAVLEEDRRREVWFEIEGIIERFRASQIDLAA
jgi:hypothetical protein